MAKEYKAAVLITGDASGAQKAIKLTEDQLSSLNDSIKKTSSTAGSFKIADGWQKELKSVSADFAKWGAAAVAASAAVGIALVKSAIDSADATGVLANKLGITTEALSKLQYAAKLSDVSQGALESGLRKLTTTLVAASDPASKAAKSFSAIGLSASELINLPADVQLAKIGDALSRVENTSTRAALAQNIFGKSGQALLPLLSEGEAGIRALGDEAQRLGVVISGDTAASAMAFNDNLDRLKYAAQGLGLSVAEQVLPQMESFTQQLTDLAQQKETAEGIASFIEGIGRAVVFTVQTIADTGNAFRFLGEEIAALVGGPAVGDINRIDEAIGRLKEKLKPVYEQGGTSAGLVIPIFISDEERAKIEQDIARLEQVRRVSEELIQMEVRAKEAANAAAAKGNEIAEIDLATLPRRRTSIQQVTAALNGQSDAQKAAAASAEAQRKRQEALVDELRFEVSQLGKTERAQRINIELRKAGVTAASAEGQEIARLTGILYDNEQAAKAAEDATRAHEQAMAQAAQQSNPWAEALQGAVERVDSAFVDMWKNIGSGFDSFADSLKESFKQLLAELAHLAITRRIVMSISAAFGLGGSSGAMASAGNAGSMFSGIGSLFSGAKSFLGGFQSGGLSGGIDALFGGAGSAIPSLFEDAYQGLGKLFGSLGLDKLQMLANGKGLAYGASSVGGSLANFGLELGAGFAGNFAGNKLGQSLFGERKTTGIGGGIGGTIGGVLGGAPGAFIGSFLGSIAENAIGKIFGTGDLVKWGKLGITTGSGVPTDGSALKTITAASGLQLSAVAKRTDSEAALQLLDAFGALDSSLTEITKSLGVTVDFAGKVLGTTSLNVDNQGPNNSFGVGARLDKFSADAIKSSADDFVRQWLAEIDDKLPTRVKQILGDTSKRTAENIVKVYGFAAQLDKLLSIDVLKVVSDSVEASTKTIMDAYDETTASLIDLAQTYDGTEASMASLTEALTAQKGVAAQVAAAYQEVAKLVESTFSSAIDSIQNSLLSESELYNKRRDQIAALTDELASTVDPGKIASIVQQIDSLAMAAFNSLTEDQQKSLGQEFIGFLEEAKALAEAQVEAGRAQLATREDAVKSAIDLEVLNTAALTQQAAAETFSGAVDRFSELIGGNAFGFDPAAIIAALRNAGVEVPG